MPVIITKYLPPTNTLGPRIKATADGCKPVVVPCRYDLNFQNNHARAAEELIRNNNIQTPAFLGMFSETVGGYVWVPESPIVARIENTTKEKTSWTTESK